MRRVAIVTTAAPPWLTGTAVNPSLRAAYLSKAGFNVCIAFPWIPRKDQLLLYGRAFDTAEQQEEYIRNWMLDNAHFHFRGDVVFYEAAYDDLIGCIIQKRGVAIVDAIPQTYRDVAILEEPEHLNWVNYEALWTDSFRYVVGVIHTNYSYYAEEREGRLKSRMTVLCNKFMCQTYTDTNLHLSSATLMSSKIPGAVCVIHGVREKLFDERNTHHTQGIYFVAKALWAKGYKNLVQLYTRQREPPAISTFGSGPDFADITDCILRNSLPICHLKGREHNGANFGEYRTFFNPSDSDALCTTTAEALAMGKYVILPVHPCNEFFYAFGNCLLYRTDDELEECFRKSMHTPPTPLTTWERQQLSWEGATRRLCKRIVGGVRSFNSHTIMRQRMSHAFHRLLGVKPVDDVLRRCAGLKVVDDDSDDADDADGGHIEERLKRCLRVLLVVLVVTSLSRPPK